MERLRPEGLSHGPVETLGVEDVRSPVSGWGRGGASAVRRLRRAAEAGLTMLMILLYGAGAVAIAAYMVAALVFPEKF
jgi:hypothetical protein